MIDIEKAKSAIAQCSDALVDFTSRIVATPSLSGEEGDVAKLIIDEMKKLDYDDVQTDDVGNIIGRIKGGRGPTVMFNGHMDVVDPGPAEGWPHPAWSGQVVEGEIWGRGSVDMKGPVAAMVYGASLFKLPDCKPSGDVLITVAVQEEIGGLGSQFLMSHTTADVAIVGEPSSNQLRLGHRGRIELQVKFFGRSAHASAPHLGANPHFIAAEFLNRLSSLELQTDSVLGSATIAPTLYQTDQQSANVIPSEVTVFLDWRNVPSENEAHAVAQIESMVAGLPRSSEFSWDVKVTSQVRRTWTGATRDFASVFPPFATSESSHLAQMAGKIIESSTGCAANSDVWKFATDGGHLAKAGIPVVGFGPGDDRLAHTNQERMVVEELKTAAATYAPLATALVKHLDD